MAQTLTQQGTSEDFTKYEFKRWLKCCASEPQPCQLVDMTPLGEAVSIQLARRIHSWQPQQAELQARHIHLLLHGECQPQQALAHEPQVQQQPALGLLW